MNFTLNIEAPGLVKAIQSLADALSNTNIKSAVELGMNQEQTAIQQPQTPEQVQQTIAHQQPEPVTQQIPTAVPTQVHPNQQQASVQSQPEQNQQPMQGVPTSAPSYSMEQLAVAATQLVEAGRREEVTELLASFGASPPYLMQLPKELYGAFATKLREMGAKI